MPTHGVGEILSGGRVVGLVVAGILLTAVLVGSCGLLFMGPRAAAAAILFVIAAVSGFGFLAAGEEPGVTPWKIGYGSVGGVCLVVGIGLLASRKK